MSDVLPNELGGPPVWYLIHHVAADDQISSEDAQLFMQCIIFFFPCPHCTFHGTSYLAEHPITKSTNFFEWSVEYHNAVTRRKFKNRAVTWTVARARREYVARKRNPKLLAKALKVLFYNLQAFDRCTATVVEEVRNRRMKQYENLQLLLSILQRVWPIAEERSRFQELSIDIEHAHAYIYSVLRTLPSIQSEFPRQLDVKQDFIREAKSLLSMQSQSASSSSSSSSFERANVRASTATRQQEFQSTLVWIIVFLSLFLIFYFVLMMQGRYVL